MRCPICNREMRELRDDERFEYELSHGDTSAFCTADSVNIKFFNPKNWGYCPIHGKIDP